MIINILLIITFFLSIILAIMLSVAYKNKVIYNKVPIREPPKILNKEFIFDFTVVDPESFISRPFKAKMTLQNADLFSGSLIDQDLFDKNIKINYLNIDQNLDKTSNISFFDDTTKHYEIKNKYSLMDPFLTSGKKSIITDQMKIEFENTLNEKSKLVDTEYHETFLTKKF